MIELASPLEILSLPESPWTIYKYASLASTNTFLREQEAFFEPYSVIWTEMQTSGRGRFQRSWKAIAGQDLTFSTLVPLEAFALESRANLTQVVALSVSLLLEEYGLSPQIRWPNDLLIHGKKICGILCESLERIDSSVGIIGIGLNINRDLTSFQDIDQPATSLFCELQQRFSLKEVLQQLLTLFTHSFNEFTQEGFGQIRANIKKRLTFLEQKIIVTDAFQKKHFGKILDLNSDGTLLFSCEECQTMTFYSGEISLPKSIST